MLSGNTTAETQPKKSEVSLGMVYYFFEFWVISYDFFIYHTISYQILNQTVYELALKRNRKHFPNHRIVTNETLGANNSNKEKILAQCNSSNFSFHKTNVRLSQNMA